MHLTSKVKDNQKSIALSLLHFLGKQENDFPDHLYRLFVQFIALHSLPPPCITSLLLNPSHRVMFTFKQVDVAGISCLAQNDPMNHLCLAKNIFASTYRNPTANTNVHH